MNLRPTQATTRWTTTILTSEVDSQRQSPPLYLLPPRPCSPPATSAILKPSCHPYRLFAPSVSSRDDFLIMTCLCCSQAPPQQIRGPGNDPSALTLLIKAASEQFPLELRLEMVQMERPSLSARGRPGVQKSVASPARERRVEVRLRAFETVGLQLLPRLPPSLLHYPSQSPVSPTSTRLHS